MQDTKSSKKIVFLSLFFAFKIYLGCVYFILESVRDWPRFGYAWMGTERDSYVAS